MFRTAYSQRIQNMNQDFDYYNRKCYTIALSCRNMKHGNFRKWQITTIVWTIPCSHCHNDIAVSHILSSWSQLYSSDAVVTSVTFSEVSQSSSQRLTTWSLIPANNWSNSRSHATEHYKPYHMNHLSLKHAFFHCKQDNQISLTCVVNLPKLMHCTACFYAVNKHCNLHAKYPVLIGCCVYIGH